MGEYRKRKLNYNINIFDQLIDLFHKSFFTQLQIIDSSD